MIPFNKPYMTGRELEYIRQAHQQGMLAGDGTFTRQCHAWLETMTGCTRAFLTHSCTAALEMTALLAGIGPGDEVIMPSYTFVSTANAFVLRGGVPVFIDIHSDTLNLDETKIEAAITPKTKAVVPVHYAGVGCAMETIMALAHHHQLLVIEDAAQGLMATRKKKALGSIGHMGAVSFHETKNVTSGEGGALLVNDARFVERAEILREKGTNRSQFFRGQVDKYTWVDVGSSYLPGEIIAAFLLAQFEAAERVTKQRLALWKQYHDGFLELESRCVLRRPLIPNDCHHNAHMYYLLVEDLDVRTRLIAFLRHAGVHAVFHYVPPHSSPAGLRYGRTAEPSLDVTDSVSERLLRLPLYVDLDKVSQIIELVHKFFRSA